MVATEYSAQRAEEQGRMYSSLPESECFFSSDSHLKRRLQDLLTLVSGII